MVESAEGRTWDRISELYQGDEASVRRNFRFLTVVCEPVELDIDAVKASVQRSRKLIKKLRLAHPGVWFNGAFDFEIVDLSRVRDGRHVCRSNAELVEAILPSGFMSKYAVNVHFHAVIDLNQLSDSLFKRTLKRTWNTHRLQTRLSPLRSDKSMRDSITDICDYLFKNEGNFKFTIRDNLRSKGEKLPDELMGFLALLYSSFGNSSYRGLLIYSKSKNYRQQRITNIDTTLRETTSLAAGFLNLFQRNSNHLQP
ncbi:hypothetical protein JNW90_28975 [Micromonospora sp. STR1s_5]|nr:hypothetical protein [Micromonospora sp. STR1s_5]